MSKKKTFDCVQMKWDIQRRLEQEFPELPEPERRRRQLERLKDDPHLGCFVEKVLGCAAPEKRG